MDNTEFELDDDAVDHAFADVPQGLYYTWNDEYNGYEVNYRLKDKCTATEITVPSAYNDSNVVAIANGAFKGITSLQTINLPDSISQIGTSAFYNCSNLSSVTVGANSQLTEIASYAFSGCSSLTNFTIPSKITIIEQGLFEDCTSITEIIIPHGVTLIGGWAFGGCPNLTTIVIPNTVTLIDYHAFGGSNIESVVYYGGDISEWEKIDIDNCNGYLEDSIRYYYSETIPDEEGNYWHYVNGVPTPWTIK